MRDPATVLKLELAEQIAQIARRLPMERGAWYRFEVHVLRDDRGGVLLDSETFERIEDREPPVSGAAGSTGRGAAWGSKRATPARR